MSNKKYHEFTAGVPAGTDLLLYGDPTTGALKKVALSGLIASGTYTPTASSAVNLDALPTMSQAQYMRVGNTVTVSGSFSADETTNSQPTSFEITLPIASNIGAVEDVAGIGVSYNVFGMTMAQIYGAAGNDTAKIQWLTISIITAHIFSYTLTYQVI